MPISFILVLVAAYGTTKKLVLYIDSVSTTGNIYFVHFLTP